MVGKVKSRRMPNRKCKLCGRRGPQSAMLKIARSRFETLRQWYPEVKSMHNFAHKECLEILGLHPHPSDDANLRETIEPSMVVSRMKDISADYPDVRGPRELGQCVYERLQPEIPVSTPEGRNHLRWMVLHYVANGLRDRDCSVTVPSITAPPTAVTCPTVVVPATADPAVCERCCHTRLQRKVDEDVPAHSIVAAKRAQRRYALEYLVRHGARGCAVIFVDDRLPVLCCTTGTSTYFAEDVLADAVLAGRITPDQLFSPNINPRVVADLKALGLVFTDVMCLHLYIQRCSAIIRDRYNGAVLVWADVWGSFADGAGPMLELSVKLRLFEPRLGGCLVMCAVSDRNERSQGRTVAEVMDEIRMWGNAVVTNGINGDDAMPPMGGQLVFPSWPADLRGTYRTMQLHTWQWKPSR